MTDPKYDGVRISRQQLYTDGDEKDDDNSDEAEQSSENASHSDEDPPEQSADEVEDEATEHRQVDHSPKDSDGARPIHSDDLQMSLKRVREEERKKGTAVARQQVRDDIVELDKKKV